MPGVISTSIAAERGDLAATPSTASVAQAAIAFAHALGGALGTPIEGI